MPDPRWTFSDSPSSRTIRRYKDSLRHDPCAYCDEPADVIDHIEPRSGGGANTWCNLIAACRDCNGRKGTKSLIGYMGLRAIALDPWPVSALPEIEFVRALCAFEHRSWSQMGRPA